MLSVHLFLKQPPTLRVSLCEDEMKMHRFNFIFIFILKGAEHCSILNVFVFFFVRRDVPLLLCSCNLVREMNARVNMVSE